MTPAKVSKAIENAGLSLTEKQIRILQFYIGGMSKSAACEAAGFPPTLSWSAFNHPKMAAAVGAVVDQFLTVEAAPAALRLLYKVVDDDKMAAGVRVQAANSLLDRAGFTAKRHEKQDDNTRDVSTMSADELRAQIAKLEAEMQDVTPDSDAVSGAIDSYDADFA